MSCEKIEEAIKTYYQGRTDIKAPWERVVIEGDNASQNIARLGQERKDIKFIAGCNECSLCGVVGYQVEAQAHRMNRRFPSIRGNEKR